MTKPLLRVSFNFSNERELDLNYRNIDQARQDVFECIEMIYNPKHEHTNKGLQSPIDFENKLSNVKSRIDKGYFRLFGAFITEVFYSMENGSDPPQHRSPATILMQNWIVFVKSGLCVALVVKSGLVILNFTLISFAARSLEENEFGHYTILFSAIGLLSVIATIGQEFFVLRTWNETIVAGNAGKIKGILYFSFAVSLIGTLLAVIGYVIWVNTFVAESTVFSSTIYLCAFPLVLVCMHLVRAQIGVALGDGLGNVIIVIVPILYLSFCIISERQAELSDLFLALAIGACIALALLFLIIIWRVFAKFPSIVSVHAIANYKEWLLRSSKFWFATSLMAISQYIDVILIGYLINPVVAGSYFVISRLANLFSAVADAVELAGSTKLPRLYYQQESKTLAKNLDDLAWMTLILNVLGLLCMMIGGYLILHVINEAYTRYFPELLLLCLGSAAIGSVRSSTIMLLITGYEGRFLQISCLCLLLRLIGFVILIPIADVWGAVLASSISFIVQAAAIRWSDKSLTGQDSSMFRLLSPS